MSRAALPLAISLLALSACAGATVLEDAGIPAWTSGEIRAVIPEVFEARSEAFADRYAPD